MADQEDIEKVRQEIMRFHELLTIMRERVQDGERAYTRLFANCSPEDIKNMKEKELQWQVAQQIIDDLSPLRKAVLQMRYSAREMEHGFEELYNIIVAGSES